MKFFKKKNIYQNGYFIEFYSKRKNENAPPSITAEISKPYIGIIFEDKYKLNCLLSMINLINLSIVEGQRIPGFYMNIKNLTDQIIFERHWIISYCEWLFRLLTLIGYQIDYIKNTNNNYFNLNNQKFENKSNNSNITFPHNLFSSNKTITYKNINAVFIIFESIFLKNHLDSNNYKLIEKYMNFKKIILKRLYN